MNKKFLKTLVKTSLLTMLLVGLTLTTLENEDPPLRGENINIEYHIC